MVEITRRTALGLLAAVAAPSASAVAVAAAESDRPMTIEAWLAQASAQERLQYHTDRLTETLKEIDPSCRWRQDIDQEHRYVLIFGHKLEDQA